MVARLQARARVRSSGTESGKRPEGVITPQLVPIPEDNVDGKISISDSADKETDFEDATFIQQDL